MDRQRDVIDPMFATRVTGRGVPTYTRRTSEYRPAAGRVMDIHPAEPPKAVLAKQRAAARNTHNPAPQYHQAPKAAVAQREPKNPRRTKRRLLRFRLPNRQTAVLYGMASVVFLVGLGVSLSGLHTNHQVAAQVKQGQQKTDASVADNPAAPSTTPISAAAVKSYAVSPNVPKYIDIPKLKVHARILSEGVTKSGQLQVPWNIYDTGWYNASSQPGQNGAMLVDGHSGIGNMHGVFYQLASLVAGDTITVTRGDNRQFTYKVVMVQTVNVSSVNMSDMLVSADTSKPGLNLITCAGDRIPGTDELNARVELFAVLQ
ncbi:MAG: class F sortase [Candidatus Saccharibacteria bacterium]